MGMEKRRGETAQLEMSVHETISQHSDQMQPEHLLAMQSLCHFYGQSFCVNVLLFDGSMSGRSG